MSKYGKKVGIVTDPHVNEASSLALSQTNNDVFWTMNDSGGSSCVYALSKSGKILHTLCLDGAKNKDWEAICIAPCDPK